MPRSVSYTHLDVYKRQQLTQPDATLGEFASIVTSLQGLATQAASSTLSTSHRAAVGTQIASYYQNLLSLANTRDGSGNPLFGGQGAGLA